MAQSFPEKPFCPKMCNDSGGFEKVPMPSENVKLSKETKKEEPAPPKPVYADDDDNRPANPVSNDPIPSLKPGPDGKVDWTPLASLTGTRPPVNKYALSRYSLDEWRLHNEKVMDPSILDECNISDYNIKTSVLQAFGNVDKQQTQNTNKLKQKSKDLFRWKREVEKACKAMTEEVEALEGERQRLKGASRVLMLPESISKECLDLRSNRREPDLCADLAEQALIKEMKLVDQIRTTYKTTLQKIEDQLDINKAVKHKIEYDWCDKQTAYDTDTLNLKLNTKDPTILFRPGSTRYSDFTAPLEYWEFYCKENIQNCEEARQKSVDLRGSINSILVDGGRGLRTLADKTDMALAETVAITKELCTKLEEQLKETLQKLADMENLIEDLNNSLQKMDLAMKLAQTRLENRNIGRPRGENVRDLPHLGLIDEVKKIHETVTCLLGQRNNAERLRSELMKKRRLLESDIAAKRKTLSIDRDRCGVIRSHYPSASELAGY